MFIGLLSACTIRSFVDSLAFHYKGSINNRPCQARSKVVDTNSNQTPLYLFVFSFNKCGGSFSTIDGPYNRVFVPNKVKTINIKVFDLI